MKRSGKRLLAVLLCLAMAMTLLPVSALARWDDDAIPMIPAEQDGKAAVKAELPMSVEGDDVKAELSAGTITPDGAVTDTWTQVADTKVTGSVDPVVENGKLKLTAVAGNGNNCDGSPAPAFFVNEQLNAAVAAAGEGERELSFDITPNSTTENICLGFGLNYTDRSHETFIGYNTIGGWFIQYYGGVNDFGGGTAQYPGFTGPALTKGTACHITIKWTDEKITLFQVGDTECTIPNSGSFGGVTLADVVGFKCGKDPQTSGVTSMEISNLHYTNQATVNVYDVSGKVSDEKGAGLAEVEITAGSYTATTASNGTYTLELPSGEYTLTAKKDGYATATKAVTVGSANLTGQNMTMEVSHTVDMPVDAAVDITNWTKVQGSGADEPRLEDGRLILKAGLNNHEKLVNGSAAIYTNSTIEQDLAAVDGKKWISFKLTPTGVKSNTSFAEDYLGFGITLNYNGQTGSNASGYYIGFCTHNDNLFFQEWNADGQPWGRFTLPGGLKPGQEMQFYIEWTDTTILLKINDTEIPLTFNGGGTNQMTATGSAITNKIAFSMGSKTLSDTALQDVTIQTQLTLSDIHFSGQQTEKGHTLAGTVKDDHNKVLSGATVSTGSGKYTATTDSNGKYNLLLPEAGSAYTVTAELDGYTTATKQVTVNAQSDYRELEATDFTLPLLPVISGTVKDTKGKGIFGATVVSDKRPEGAYTTTDADGNFTVIGAVDGEHNLEISAEGYETATKTVTVSGQNVTGVEITLEDRVIPSYTLSTDDMDVKVAEGFPQVIQYILKDGKTMHGQTAELDTIKINGVAVEPTVTSVKSDDNKKVTYTMVIDDSNNATTGVTATITAEIRVGLDDINDKDSEAAGRTLGFYITDVDYPNNDRLDHPVDTIEIPNHSLVSVRSTEEGAAVTGGKLAANTISSGDTTYVATESGDKTGTGENFFAAFIYNNELSAGLASNSAYGTSSAGSDTYPVRAQFEAKDGGETVSIGLGSTLWYYDHDITQNEASGYTKLGNKLTAEQKIIAPLDMPYAKVVITEDMNGSGTVDWQDGAIAYRETVMHIPVGGEQVANTANLRISMNFGSMATNPFLIALDNVKRVSAHTDGLGQFVLLKGYAGEGHDSNHPQYDNIGIRMGGPEDLKTLLEEGEKLGAAFGIHTNASEFYAEAIKNNDQVLRSTSGMKYGWNWLDQGISINAVYDYASGLRKARWDALYDIVKGHPFTVYVDVWGNLTSGKEDDFQTRALSNEILEGHDGWRIAHEWAWANPYESTFQHWTTDFTYGTYSDKGKLNSNVIRFILNQYKDSFTADFASYGGAANAPLLGGPAMQGFEGWQGDGEYDLSIYNTFNQMVYTKFLQHYPVVEWTNAEKAVTIPYNGAGAGAARNNSTTSEWVPEAQIKLSDGKDEIVVTRGTSGKLVTDFKMDTLEKFLAGETEYRSRVVTLNGKVIVTGAPASAGEDSTFPASKATLKYLIPWYWKVDGTPLADADEKLYHWNAQGGQSTWELPDGWEGLGTVILYELSDQGRDAGKTVKVIDGKITLSGIKADTGYVVTKGENAKNAPVIEYGTGLHLGDPSFNMDTARADNPWTVSGKGSAIHTTNAEGIGVLKMTGEVSISQIMTDLTPGTNYVSYVAVDNRSNAEARMTITDQDGNMVATNYTMRSIAKNYVSSYYLHNGHGIEAGGSYFQNMFVYFTPEADKTYTMTLSREAGAGNVYFDDLRTVEYGFNYSGFGAGQTDQNEKGSATIPVVYDPETGAAIELHQDFENVPQGVWPFVVGPVEGVNDNRTHVSELNVPFTQAGWDVKKLDDVIDGNWSIKSNGLSGRNNLVYQTIPQNFRFEAGKVYTVSFDYELGTTNSYQVVVGDGAYTGYDSLTVYPLTGTLKTTVPATPSTEGTSVKGNVNKADVGHIEFTVVGSESGQTWIGIYSKNNADNQGTSGSASAFGGYLDFVLDNLHIEAAPVEKQELATLLQQADAMTNSDIYSAKDGTDDAAAWTAMTTARATGHTVFDTENASQDDVTNAVNALKAALDNLEKVAVSISGTVTNANSKPVAGVVLTLENAAYFPTGLTVTTGEDGTFTFVSKSGVELVPGTYHIKAQCTGYNVTTTGNIVVTKADAAKTENISLEAEAPGAYVNDFNQCLNDGSESIGYGSMGNLLNEDELETLSELTKEEFDALSDTEKSDYLKSTVLPTMQWMEYNGSGALKVTWHANTDSQALSDTRYVNNVVDKTIAFVNGSASYDVTALTTGVRFNVALRASETKKLVTVGQQETPKKWMGEFWNTDGSGCSSEMTTNVLAVEPGVTRNIRIDANGTTFTVYVDGIQAYQTTLGDSSYYYVYSWTGAEATPLVDPGYIGINMRYGAGTEFIIDNIRITTDEAAEGTHSVGGTVTAGGEAVAGAAIDLVNSAGERVDGTSTNALGQYQIKGVAPGKYTLKASAPFFQNAEMSITVGSADLTGKDFTLKLDKSSLTTLIDEVKALNEEDYTEETWAELADALDDAKTVAESDTATVAALNTAYRDLSNAKEALVMSEKAAADFSELRDLHKEMANKPNDNYTNGTWNAFQAALEDAHQVLLAGTATQEEVDAAKDALQAAYDALDQATPVDEMDLTALEAAYDAAKDVEKGNASDEKWAAFEAARDAALAIISNADGLTQADVDAATKALTDAQSGLRRSGSSSTPSTTTKTETREDGTKVTTVTAPDGTVTETVKQPDGTTSETVTTKDGDVTITVTDADGEELVKTEIPATIPEPETKFVDIDDLSWAVEAINNVAALKLVNGVGNNKYDPATPMTRGQIAAVLHRLSNGKTDYKAAFKDVQSNKYYAEGVAWAAKANVVKGVSTDRFAPDRIITREQLATMLCRYAKLIGMDTAADSKSLDAFVDGENTGSWAVDSMAWCVENGILKGKGNGVLDPNADVSRAEVAVMLDRFLALIKK